MNREFRLDSNDNNRCLFCCQPPSTADDPQRLLQSNLEILERAPENLPCIGISGGEPTLAGKCLFTLLDRIREKYPECLIHFLSNGRLFADKALPRRFMKYDLDNILFGIPLHSDYDGDHDRLTQAEGSFNETMTGLYALAELNARIELRIVVSQWNFRRLERMAEFIFSNLPFVETVAFMGMEMTGYAIPNAAEVWVDPADYQEQLRDAVLLLHRWRMRPLIFNLPLCLLPQELHPFACKSISDWKTSFADTCTLCALRDECCGLFATSKWQSRAIHPIG